MSIKTWGLLLVPLMLSSCATFEKMQPNWAKDNCNKEAAYNRGLTQGLTSGWSPQPSYYKSCPPPTIGLQSAYLRGYSEGAHNRPQEITINKNVTVSHDE